MGFSLALDALLACSHILVCEQALIHNWTLLHALVCHMLVWLHALVVRKRVWLHALVWEHSLELDYEHALVGHNQYSCQPLGALHNYFGVDHNYYLWEHVLCLFDLFLLALEHKIVCCRLVAKHSGLEQ